MGRIRTSYRYEIDIIGPDPFYLRKVGVVNLEKCGSVLFEGAGSC